MDKTKSVMMGTLLLEMDVLRVRSKKLLDDEGEDEDVLLLLHIVVTE
jgi:hypothetical protein